MALFRRVKPPFSLKTLQKDSNCIAIQDPSAVWGVQDFPPSSYSGDDKLAWGAIKNVPWVQSNALIVTDDLTNAAWTKSSTTAPSAGLLQCSAATATHEFRSATGPITPVVGQTYYLSCKAKQGTTPYVQLACFSGMHSTAYANFDLSAGAAGTSTACTPTITGPDGDGYYTVTIAVVATGTSAASGFRLSIQQSASDTRQQSWAAAGTENVNVKNMGLYVGSLPSYQAIGADWDTTYTAAAIAAGYPISIWQDSAGTKAVSGDNQPIGKMLNYKLNGLYDAIQATSANQPKWRLDANGKAYIERDLTNDSLPITLPTVLSDAQWGGNLSASTDFSSQGAWAGTNWSFSSGMATHAAGSTGSLFLDSAFTVGSVYKVTYVIASVSAGSVYARIGTNSDPVSRASPGTYTHSGICIGDGTLRIAPSSDFVGSIDAVYVQMASGTNVVYTAEGNVTLKDSGITLNGSYAPITPAADYGRIIMAGDSRYDAKILKYLDAKRGRGPYVLGPELVTNGGFDSDTVWTKGTGWSIGSGVASASSAADATMVSIASVLTSGKTYLVQYDVTSLTAGGVRTYAGATTGATRSAVGKYQGVIVCGATNQTIGVAAVGTTTASIDNVSVREVIL